MTPPSSDNEAIPPVPSSSGRGSAKRKIMKRDRSKTYRNLKKAENEISILKKERDKYKKRFQRLKIKMSAADSSPSPNAKFQSLLSGRTVPEDVKRQLLFGEALKTQIEKNVFEIGQSEKEKQCVRKILTGNVLKRYKMQGLIKRILPYKQNKKLLSNKNILSHDRKKRICILSEVVKRELKAFFERGDISKMCPGKKDFVKMRNIKKQKRLLLVSLKEAYEKFTLNSASKMSYTTFIKGKPFCVVAVLSFP